jgi:hypothetical protein
MPEPHRAVLPCPAIVRTTTAQPFDAFGEQLRIGQLTVVVEDPYDSTHIDFIGR